MKPFKYYYMYDVFRFYTIRKPKQPKQPIITPEIKAIIKDAFDNSCKYSSFKDFCETYKIK